LAQGPEEKNGRAGLVRGFADARVASAVVVSVM
jgi:hypothetical protein